MAEFKFAGQRYNTEDLSESQSELTKSLSFTKNLVKEIEEILKDDDMERRFFSADPN